MQHARVDSVPSTVRLPWKALFVRALFIDTPLIDWSGPVLLIDHVVVIGGGMTWAMAWKAVAIDRRETECSPPLVCGAVM